MKMIWFLVLILPLALLAWGIWGKARDGGFDAGDFRTSFGCIFTFIALLILLISTIVNAGAYARLKAFSEQNIYNYSTTVDKTSALLSTEEFKDVLIQGSLEKTELAKAVSERYAEWRDDVNEYNLNVASMQYFNKTLLGALYPDGCMELKYLKLDK
jgi:hypothetical protein